MSEVNEYKVLKGYTFHIGEGRDAKVYTEFCKNCNGTGKNPQDHTKTCAICFGRGTSFKATPAQVESQKWKIELANPVITPPAVPVVEQKPAEENHVESKGVEKPPKNRQQRRDKVTTK